VAIRSNVSASGSANIQDGSITESKIAAGSIDADHFKSGAFDALLDTAGISAAELAVLGAVTASAAELNVLDGIAATLTAAELSILDGVTATAAELNLLDGVTSSALVSKTYKFTYDFSVHNGGIATNEVQTLTIDATGGTFTAAWDGGTASSALAENITSADLQTALRALDTDLASVTVSGDGPHTITFAGAAVAAQPIGLTRLLFDGAALTGGAGDSVVVTTAGNTGVKTLTAANGQLPSDFVISGVISQCVTPATSGGAATIALGYTGAATQFCTATAYTDNMFDTSNQVTNVLADFGAHSATTAAVDVIATVADAALTAGKFLVWVTGFEGL